MKEGTVYFFVNFVDHEMLIPTMDTVVYVGRDLAAGDSGKVYFQDIDSFERGVRFGAGNQDGHAVFQCGSQDELGHVFEYDKAVEVLIACLLRQRERKSSRGLSSQSQP